MAVEVARALQAPLDVLVVRKLGMPFQPELVFGAIGEDDARVLNDLVVRESHLGGDDLDSVERKQRIELRRRAERSRRGHDRISLTGRIAVIVDRAAHVIGRSRRLIVRCHVNVDDLWQFCSVAHSYRATPRNWLRARAKGRRNCARKSGIERKRGSRVRLYACSRVGNCRQNSQNRPAQPPLNSVSA